MRVVEHREPREHRQWAPAARRAAVALIVLAVVAAVWIATGTDPLEMIRQGWTWFCRVVVAGFEGTRSWLSGAQT